VIGGQLQTTTATSTGGHLSATKNRGDVGRQLQHHEAAATVTAAGGTNAYCQTDPTLIATATGFTSSAYALTPRA